jgi:hypothetical protein
VGSSLKVPITDDGYSEESTTERKLGQLSEREREMPMGRSSTILSGGTTHVTRICEDERAKERLPRIIPKP